MAPQIDIHIVRQAEDLISQNCSCYQIAGRLNVSTSWVYNLKTKLSRKEAICPVCREPWKLKGDVDPHRSVADYISMHGCSRCLERGISAAKGLVT